MSDINETLRDSDLRHGERRTTYMAPPDRDMARASGNMRPGDFMNDLTNAVRDNPLPAALIGMGILWMFAGGSDTSISEAMEGRPVRRAARKVARTTRHAGESLREGASYIGEKVSDAVSGTAESISSAAGAVRNRVLPQHEASYEEGYSGQDEEPVGGPVWGGRADPGGWQSQGSSVPQGSFRQGLADYLEQRPLMLGAAGVALGAGIAASLPLTQKEREVFGKANSYLHDKMSEMKEHAKEVTSAVTEEIKSQGS